MQPETAFSTMRIRFICRSGSVALCCIGAGLLLPGCGNVLYTYRADSASSKLEAARQAGAEKTALYEYTLAQEHLNKAMSEASEADYGDAYELAQLADQFAEQSLKKARLRNRVFASGIPAAPVEREPEPQGQAVPTAVQEEGTARPAAESATTVNPGSNDHEEQK